MIDQVDFPLELMIDTIRRQLVSIPKQLQLALVREESLSLNFIHERTARKKLGMKE